MISRLTAILLGAVAIGGTGCTLAQIGRLSAPPPPPQTASIGLPLRVSASSRQIEVGLDPIVSQVRFQVFCDALVVDVPAGTLSASAELWSHLGEDALSAKLADHMTRNGFRIGIGKGADFGLVNKLLLTARDARTRSGQMQFESDVPAEMSLDPQPRDRHAWVYAMDGSAAGADYLASTTFFWVGAWHDVEHLDTVNLMLVPEIRFGKDKRKYFTPGLPQPDQYADAGKIFTEVKLDLRQERGDFLVLAPRPKGGAALVVGRALLTDTANMAQPRELIVLIRPRVVRTPMGP